MGLADRVRETVARAQLRLDDAQERFNRSQRERAAVAPASPVENVLAPATADADPVDPDALTEVTPAISVESEAVAAAAVELEPPEPEPEAVVEDVVVEPEVSKEAEPAEAAPEVSSEAGGEERSN